MKEKKIRILHITEALGGGVLNIIQQLSDSQSNSGHEVIVAHSIRADTPSKESLDILFPRPIKIIVCPMTSEVSPRKDLESLAAILKIIKNTCPDIIHLHSSKAGVLGRIASLITGRSNSCFYTPHGFSFLRKDITKTKRTIFQIIEIISSHLGGTTLACSRTELEHSKKSACKKKSILIENSIPLQIIKKVCTNHKDNCVIVNSARICPQKNPSIFRDISLKIKNTSARFLWIGGGDSDCSLRINGEYPRNLEVTGWMPREKVSEILSSSDIFLMTSLWEGMPLALLEAQASGLPAIVPAVEGCKDVVIDKVTGFICETTDEMVEKLNLLIENKELRLKLGNKAREIALERFSPERMHRETMKAYESSLKN